MREIQTRAETDLEHVARGHRHHLEALPPVRLETADAMDEPGEDETPVEAHPRCRPATQPAGVRVRPRPCPWPAAASATSAPAASSSSRSTERWQRVSSAQ